MCNARLSLYRLIRGLEDPKQMIVEESFIVTPEQVEAALALGQDTNRLHQDEVLAKSLGFAGIVAPGALLDAKISGFVARNFPDGIVAQSKEVEFKRACYVGDAVTMSLWYRSHTVVTLAGTTYVLGFSLENQRGKALIVGSCSIIFLKKLQDQLGVS